MGPPGRGGNSGDVDPRVAVRTQLRFWSRTVPGFDRDDHRRRNLGGGVHVGPAHGPYTRNRHGPDPVGSGAHHGPGAASGGVRSGRRDLVMPVI